MKRFLKATFPGLEIGIVGGLLLYFHMFAQVVLLMLSLGFGLLMAGCGPSGQNTEAAHVLQSKDPCFVIARDPSHVTCLHGARKVQGWPQYRGRLPQSEVGRLP